MTRTIMHGCVLMATCWILALAGAAAGGPILFQDTFDRANDSNIEATLTGITDNTGSSLPAGGVYSQPYRDPNNNPSDTISTDGGASRILNNQLQLAVGPGTSNLFVNHNFINPAILAAGGFRVSLDVLAFTQTTWQQGGGFAIGMSQAQAASTSDAFSGDPTGAKMTNFMPNQFMRTVSDFWIGVRGDTPNGQNDGTDTSPGEVAWGNGPVAIGAISFANITSKSGSIAVDFHVADFNHGSTVNYEVFYNSTSLGTGSFTWNGANENYIGIDVRDSTSVTLDNFSITLLVPEPGSAVLLALGGLVAALRGRRRDIR